MEWMEWLSLMDSMNGWTDKWMCGWTDKQQKENEVQRVKLTRGQTASSKKFSKIEAKS